jgi:hypothetical protein
MYNTFGQNLYGATGQLLNDQVSSFSLIDGVVAPTTGALADEAPVTGTSIGLYTKPTMETPFINYGNDPFHVKDDSGLMIDAGWTLGNSLVVSRANQDYIGNGVPTFVPLQQTWNPGLQDRRLSTPREGFRQNAYKFQFENGQQPVYGAVFNMYQEFIRGPEEDKEK